MILNCKNLIKEYTNNIKAEVEAIEGNIKPSIALIRVGNDPASITYVGLKEKKCEEVGIISNVFEIAEDITTEELIKKIEKLNDDINTSGILVQLPLPKHIDEQAVLSSISVTKDVDGLGVLNAGSLLQNGNPLFTPCTPFGIMSILNYSGISLEGMKVLIINRSNIVGKPLAQLMIKENAMVTIAHSKISRKDLNEEIKRSDIIITAVGKKDFINEKYKPVRHQVFIDVSINRDDDGKLCGDVSKKLYDNNKLLITPVPGSIGPMTVLSLLDNTCKAFSLQQAMSDL